MSEKFVNAVEGTFCSYRAYYTHCPFVGAESECHAKVCMKGLQIDKANYVRGSESFNKLVEKIIRIDKYLAMYTNEERYGFFALTHKSFEEIWDENNITLP